MYKAYVTKLKNVRKHSNADRLMVGECFGNNVIVNLNYNEGDIGIYFPVDGQLGVEFATQNNLLVKRNENGENTGGYLDPNKRNIRALKLRGEQSDGLFLPLSSMEQFCDISTLKEGDTVDILNGIMICQKYIPVSNKKSAALNNNNLKNKLKQNQKDKFPFFSEHIDTSQLAYNQSAFKEGDICTISLKMHGTSARIANTIKIHKKKRLFRKPVELKTWDVVSGSRRVTLSFKSGNNGFYGTNDFREKWHNQIAPKLEKGETLYGEIVGWINDNTTIMGVCQNKKVSKEFAKKFGDTTTFSYGCQQGDNDFYVYRMAMTNEDGFTVEYPTWYAKLRVEQMGLKFVPVFEQFIYSTWEDLMSRVEILCGGVDPIGQTHIREGVVVRIENREKFKALKHKNFEFKVLEGIVKENATEPDIEEQEDCIKCIINLS